jgi:hypothetical protein
MSFHQMEAGPILHRQTLPLADLFVPICLYLHTTHNLMVFTRSCNQICATHTLLYDYGIQT